ncbi:PQQ-binding-like beta-propeller repeat protein [Roseimicrobium sp. ORNL1]|nr:PQQ-binding-like beta-propeller repeat protein [Roseimicrobium sp. ORNL1]
MEIPGPTMLRRIAPLAVISCLSAATLHAEWNQWRGSQRNGVSDDSTPIAGSLPEGSLTPIWESGTIPSDHDGGHSSPVVSGGRVYLSVVWHTRVPSETRLIDEEVVSAVGHRGTNQLGPELTKKMEDARKSRPGSTRGTALDEAAKKWVDDNFNEEQKLVLGTWAEQRFKQGKNAIDVELLDKVAKRQNKPFANAAEMMTWAEAEFPDAAVRERILKAIPDTLKVGRDTIVCLDGQTGKELWKFEHEGQPTGRRTSGTPAVVDGKVYAVGSTHLYAVDAEKGSLVWKTELKPAGAGSSPLVNDDKVYVMAGGLMCVEAATGKSLWTSKDVKGDTASPILWKTSDGKTTLVCNANKGLIGLDPTTGEKRWEVEGGGQSSPVIEGDHLVIFSGTQDVGLRCYLAQKDAAPKTLWSHWWMSRRYTGSPIIHEGHVYLMCGGKHQCVSLADGKVKWQEDVESTITSPLLVDGKILSIEQNGIFLRLIKADPTSYQLLGRAKVEAMWCPTPAPYDGRLIVRRKDKVVCFDLRQK